MPEDVDEHVAMAFHGLVSDLQRNDVERFEAEQKRDAEARAALRRLAPEPGMNAAELLRKMDGDPADEQRRIEDDLAKVEREAKAAVAARQAATPVSGHFPPPPESE